MDCTELDYKNIPVQSEIISGIVRLDAESPSCFRELDSFVSSDQGVATLLLRVANSALYSRGQQIATIPRAISLLGFNVVRSIAILAFSRSLFAQTHNPLFHEHIWQHSLLTAIAGQNICGDLGDPRGRDDAFIAGIMHDIGKVLLFTHDQQAYLGVLQRILDTGCSSREAEHRLLDIDHYQVGREAVGQWKLPQRFIDYMATDLSLPRPEYAEDRVRLSLAAANSLIRGLGIGARPLDDFEARKSALMAFGIEQALCDRWLQDAFLEGLQGSDTYQLCAKL